MQNKVGKVKEITSLSNPIIKDIKSLGQKKHRQREGLFLAEGLKLILEGVEFGWQLNTLVFAKSDAPPEKIQKLAAYCIAKGGLVIEASQKVLAAISHRDNPQAAIGVFSQQLAPLEHLSLNKGDIYIGLDRIRDPGNLGTIIRTADAVGAKAIVLIGDCVDPFSMEAVRATMGSIFALPLYRADEQTFLNWRQSAAGLFVATHLKGDKDYRDIGAQNQPIFLLMGNEQQGLSDNLAQCCNQLVKIAQTGRADSLNLAVATAVMLYELRRNTIGRG